MTCHKRHTQWNQDQDHKPFPLKLSWCIMSASKTPLRHCGRVCSKHAKFHFHFCRMSSELRVESFTLLYESYSVQAAGYRASTQSFTIARFVEPPEPCI